MHKGIRWLLVVAALMVATAGCGSDKKDDAADKKTDATTTTVADKGDDETDDTTDDTTDDDGDDTADAPMAGSDVCKLAIEMSKSEDLPTAEQLKEYQRVAPAEVEDAVAVAVPPLSSVGGDPVKFFAAYAEDDVENAVDDINAFETEQCGVDHSDDGGPPLPEGATQELEDDATRVDVTAKEYTFDIPEELSAGRTSFVLTDAGKEAHFLLIVKLEDGVSLETALQSEEGEGIASAWESRLAAPGGEDEEFLSLDLEPGEYGAACFLPGPDGKPHAMSGMAKPFTVA